MSNIRVHGHTDGQGRGVGTGTADRSLALSQLGCAAVGVPDSLGHIFPTRKG